MLCSDVLDTGMRGLGRGFKSSRQKTGTINNFPFTETRSLQYWSMMLGVLHESQKPFGQQAHTITQLVAYVYILCWRHPACDTSFMDFCSHVIQGGGRLSKYDGQVTNKSDVCKIAVVKVDLAVKP